MKEKIKKYWQKYCQFVSFWELDRRPCACVPIIKEVKNEEKIEEKL